MSKPTGKVVGHALAVIALSAAVLAHEGDPKARDIRPPYQGPGYRAAQGGVAGMEFDSVAVSLLSWVPLGEFSAILPGQFSANTCWGYVSPSGREYALIGLEQGTGFVEITDPDLATVIAVKAGPASVWRDIKVYQQHAYAVSEGGNGIQVFDLSKIDNGVVTHVGDVTSGGLTATHTVALNEATGYLYRCGGGGNGLRIYSLADPAAPQLVASWSDRYVHEAEVVTMKSGPWAGREIAFCCSGFNGGWADTGINILDVTDKANIVSLIPAPQPWYEYPQGAYSHQCWLSEDQRFLFLNDEQDEATYGLTSTLHIIDVTDLTSPAEISTFTNGVTAITHNLYVRGHRIYAANYNSGLRVFDVSNPVSPSEIAYFDTSPDQDLSFSNLWGNYPLFPSGTVIGSDRTFGLFVWDVADSSLSFEHPAGLPEMLDPEGATIQVAITVADGEIESGTPALRYRVDGGPFNSLALVPAGGGLYQATLPALGACPAVVDYYFTAQTEDGLSWSDPAGAPASTYTAVAASTGNVVFEDHFETDLGWQVVNVPESVAGAWERGVPEGCQAGDPSADADGSGQCELTGIDPEGCGADVDGGVTAITSPSLDAGGPGEPFVVYSRWYSNNTGPAPNQDSMLVLLSNDDGSGWSPLEVVTESAGRWVHKAWRISDFTTPSAQMRLRLLARDFAADSLVEAGLDDVRIVYYACGDAVAGDVNGDGSVNVLDLTAVITSWGPCPPGPCPADLDGSGAVDVLDLVIVITAWT
jgi:choice-of-anchor B domain-containing protein